MKKRLSSVWKKARDALSQAKKRRKIGVVSPEATAHFHIAEGARQFESRESLISQDVGEPEIFILRGCAVNDEHLPGQQQ